MTLVLEKSALNIICHDAYETQFLNDVPMAYIWIKLMDNVLFKYI